MDYVNLELLIGRSEYEERVRWLQALYGAHTPSEQPGRITRIMNVLLFTLGRNLVSLGEHMQSRHDMHLSPPTTK